MRVRNALTNVGYTEALVAMQRPMVLDPLFSRGDAAVTDVGALTYRSLMKLNPQAVPVPDLASSVKTSSDGLTYTIRLGHAKWSDGHDITVSDVLNTIAIIEQPGYTDKLLAGAWQDAAVTSSGNDISIHLSVPRASFETALTQLPILPLGAMNHSELATLQSRDSLPLPTSGPYKVIDSSITTLTLATNSYAAQKPALKILTFNLFGDFDAALADFKAGTSDGIVAITPQQRSSLSALHRGRLYAITTFRFDDLLLNEQVPALGDSNVRAALAQVIDRSEIVAKAFNGGASPQLSAIPQGITWAAPNPMEFKAPDHTAVKLLEAAGWHAGADGRRTAGGQPLSLPIAVPNVPSLVATAHVISAQLRAIGIAAPVQVVPQSTFIADILNTGRFSLAVVDWNNGPDPDVSEYWRSNALPPQGFNVSNGQTDLFLDQALDSLATLPNLRDRKAAATTVADDLAADLPAIFLDAPAVTFDLGPGIKNATIPATGGAAARFDLVATWSRG